MALGTLSLNHPLDTMGISLNKHKLMYKVLVPSIIAPYKFLWTYGGSGHMYMYVCVSDWLSV